MKTLLIAEHDNVSLNIATAKALTAAAALGKPIHILVAGTNCGAVATAASQLKGVEQVLVADHALYQHALAEPLADFVVSMAGDYDSIVAPASSNGKNVLPRIAALLDVMQVSEITRVLSPDTFERPIYAGNAIQTVQATDAKKVLTVRTSAFPAAENGGEAAILPVAAAPDRGVSRFKNETLSTSERPELASARIVLSGGRALGSADRFQQLLAPLADTLGAAIGASRAAVDAGYAPNDFQVGQTGKVVAPELYIAVGISGAVQHLAGMKDSKVIVAINHDEEAPIFQIADYGLVADLFQVLPELKTELDKGGN